MLMAALRNKLMSCKIEQKNLNHTDQILPDMNFRRFLGDNSNLVMPQLKALHDFSPPPKKAEICYETTQPKE